MENLIIVTPDDVLACILGLWALRLDVETTTWVQDLDEAFDVAPQKPEGSACLVVGEVPDEDSLDVLCVEYERVIVATPGDEPQSLFILPVSLFSQALLAELLR